MSYKVYLRPLSREESKNQLQLFPGFSKHKNIDTEATSDSCHESQQPNVQILLKNTDTLEEYTTVDYINTDYMQKCQQWIDKRKFKVEESLKDMKLKIEIFEFTLNKTHKSDAELIKEELAELKREKQSLMLETKLWNHYFYSFMDERSRKAIAQKDYLVEPIVDSPKSLYNQCEGLAFVEEDELGNKKCYLGFKQPLQFLFHTASSAGKSEDSMMIRQRPQQQQMMINTNQMQQNQAPITDEWFELFISGKSFPHNLALVSAKAVRQIKLPLNGGVDLMGSSGGESIVYHLHKINLQLHKNATYTVYTPKIFN